jgi:4-hydroxy-tetrahydrodipicolinate synthase
MSAETTLRLAHDFDNIIGIKEASGSLDQCTAVLKDRPEGFMVISGDDTLSLPIIASGGDGVISVVANALPKQYSELINASLNGDLAKAQKRQYQLFDLINALFEEGNPAGVKAALNYLGICGADVRLPLVPASNQLRDKLQKLISQIPD